MHLTCIKEIRGSTFQNQPFYLHFLADAASVKFVYNSLKVSLLTANCFDPVALEKPTEWYIWSKFAYLSLIPCDINSLISRQIWLKLKLGLNFRY